MFSAARWNSAERGIQMSMKPLTIAMLSIHSSPIGALGTRDTGGMSVYVNELAREMGLRGHRVDIFTHRRHEDDPGVDCLAPNVRLVSLDIAPGRPLTKVEWYACADDTMAAIEAFRHRQACVYDLIHSHYWISGQVGRMARKAWRRPHVITFHTLGAVKTGTGIGAAEPDRRLTVERKLVQDCQGLLAPCEGEKANLMHYYGADAARINMVPGGVDLVCFRPMERAGARRRLGIDPHIALLLCIGRLTPQKGQDRIIEALPYVESDRRPHLLVVGGNGDGDPEQRRLQKLAASAGVQDWVTFCGSVAHHSLPAYYAAADMVVLASHYESFGLVGLEALACGRPVVSTPVGVLAELARMRRPGIITTEGSPAALAAGIAAARGRVPDWPAHTIRQSVQDFSWTQAAEAALMAYQAVIKADAGGRGLR
jgi:D-inositol-3-phosphate glycosyltransferase